MMGKTLLRADMRDRLGDLVEALLDVRDREHVAEVAPLERFAEVNAELVVVGAVER